MSKTKLYLIIAAALIVFVLVVLFLLGVFNPKGAGLLIETSPTSSVYINGEQVGRTPYQATLDSGEVVLKLIPDSDGQPLVPFETKVKLTSGIQTVVRREFGSSLETSAGEIISFEESSGTEANISVISDPDSLSVSLDGQNKGFTPVKVENVTPGEHQLSVSGNGLLERTISIRAVEGYRLTVVATLAKDESFVQESENAGETKDVVTILDTSTGFLRVRSGDSTATSEIAQVEPGEKYDLVEKNSNASWVKIKLEDKEGWISAEYASISAEPVN